MIQRTHYMETPEHKWSVGELVPLSWNERLLKKSGSTSYAELVNSRYICVREATDKQPGILVKVLGKVTRDQILLVSGTPFCKDDREELLVGMHYSSYRFPSVDELKEVLSIIRGDEELLVRFNKAGMHLNPNSTYWVRNTSNRYLFKKQAQYYDASTDMLYPATAEETLHYRLTIAYFDNKEVGW